PTRCSRRRTRKSTRQTHSSERHEHTRAVRICESNHSRAQVEVCSQDPPMKRRDFLKSTGSATVALLTGCESCDRPTTVGANSGHELADAANTPPADIE